MSRFELWFIRRVLKREVTQGFDHDRRITNLYGLIRAACEREFYEDNSITLDASLREWFEASQFSPQSTGEADAAK